MIELAQGFVYFGKVVMAAAALLAVGGVGLLSGIAGDHASMTSAGGLFSAAVLTFALGWFIYRVAGWLRKSASKPPASTA